MDDLLHYVFKILSCKVCLILVTGTYIKRRTPIEVEFMLSIACHTINMLSTMFTSTNLEIKSKGPLLHQGMKVRALDSCISKMKEWLDSWLNNVRGKRTSSISKIGIGP